MKFPNMIEMQLWENKPSKKNKTLLSSGIDSLTCSEVLKETAGYLHSIVHGRDSVYTAFTNRVGADPDVLLQLVHVGELGWASVQLERAGIINIYTVSCDITKKKVPAQHHLVSFTSDAEGCKWHFSLSMQVNNVYQMLEHPGNLSPTTKNIMSVKLTFGEEKK